MKPEVYRASAPGKVVLMGDYVVLEGAPALAAAVPAAAEATYTLHEPKSTDRRFHFEARNLRLHFACSLADADAQGEALAQAPAPLQLVLRAACAAVELSGRTLPAGTLRVDTSAFYRNGRKLGLGSSAATLVAAMRALMQAPGLSQATRDGALAQDTLIALHRAWQGGRGSGIDIATSLHGGVIRFQRQKENTSITHAAALQPSSGPPYAVIGVGHDSSTALALAAFARLKENEPRIYWSHMEELAQLGAAACEFWTLSHHIAFLPLVRHAHVVLDSLGRHMGVDIVSAPHQLLAAQAEAVGAAYKPSGAGGGDVGVAFFLDAAMRKRFLRSLRNGPATVLFVS